MNTNELISKLKGVYADLGAIISQFEGTPEANQITAAIKDLRAHGILTELLQIGDVVSKEQVSEVSRKWGARPGSSAWYSRREFEYIVQAGGDLRRITDEGKEFVKSAEEKFGGEDWVARLQANTAVFGSVSNPEANKNAKVSF